MSLEQCWGFKLMKHIGEALLMFVLSKYVQLM